MRPARLMIRQMNDLLLRCDSYLPLFFVSEMPARKTRLADHRFVVDVSVPDYVLPDLFPLEPYSLSRRCSHPGLSTDPYLSGKDQKKYSHSLQIVVPAQRPVARHRIS